MSNYFTTTEILNEVYTDKATNVYLTDTEAYNAVYSPTQKALNVNILNLADIPLNITIVANYSALPNPTTVTGKYYWVSNSQGTRWLPGSLGGTYYNSGLYFSNGATWEFMEVAYQATQSEVNSGLIYDKFVTPLTFANADKWNNIHNRQSVGTGIISGGTISIGADSISVDLTAGKIYFVDYTDTENPVLIEHAIGGNIPITNIATQSETYIGYDINGVVQQSFPYTPEQKRSIVTIGIAIHTNNLIVNAVNTQLASNVDTASQIKDISTILGRLNCNGNEFSANGVNLKINKTAGRIVGYGIGILTNPFFKLLPELIAPTFQYRLQNGTFYSDTDTIDTLNYDLNGVLTSVPNNKFTVQEITIFTSNLVRIQYGQTVYNNLIEAEAGILNSNFITEANIAENGIKRTYLIVKKEVTDLTNVSTCKFKQITKFGGVSSSGAALTSSNIILALGYVPVNPTYFGIAPNYTSFDSDGTLHSNGNATTWRDEISDILLLKQTGSGVSINSSESTVEFTSSANLSDYLYVNVQLNHDRKLTSGIDPHIHWFQSSVKVPNFLLQYRWQVLGGTKVTSWTNLRCNYTAFTYTSGNLNQVCSPLNLLMPPVDTMVSDIVQFRILRDTTNASTLFTGTDPLTGIASLLSFDVHIECDTLGSKAEYTK